MYAAITRCISTLMLTLLSVNASADLQFHWQATFTTSEQQKLRAWIKKTDDALSHIVGNQPFTRHIYLHRLENTKEPVPWAHTERGREQSVHFYVDPRFSQQAFLADWTAPHELSHLVIPYVGERNAWFAEGFASYMQYQVMQAMGVMTPVDAQRRYLKRFQKAQSNYDMGHLPFSEAAPKLREKKQYPTMYWGGAIYFQQVDTWLQLHRNSSFNTVLKGFLQCCRMRSPSLAQLIKNLDEISESQTFSAHLEHYRTHLGFPNFAEPLLIGPTIK